MNLRGVKDCIRTDASSLSFIWPPRTQQCGRLGCMISTRCILLKYANDFVGDHFDTVRGMPHGALFRSSRALQIVSRARVTSEQHRFLYPVKFRYEHVGIICSCGTCFVQLLYTAAACLPKLYSLTVYWI